MTRDDVIRMAREAGFRILVEPEIEWIERLIEMAQTEERESIAQLVEEKFDFCGDELVIAEAIRARGEK